MGLDLEVQDLEDLEVQEGEGEEVPDLAMGMLG